MPKGRKTDIERMRALLAAGLNDHQVARRMGLCRETVQKRRAELGIAPNWFSPEGLERRNRIASERCKGEGWGFSATRHRVLAARVGWAGRPVGQAFILAALEEYRELLGLELDAAVAELKGRWGKRPSCRTYNCNQTGFLIADGLVAWRYTGNGSEKLYRLSEAAREAARQRNEAHRINLRRDGCRSTASR